MNMNIKTSAFLFDLNGTMIDDMEYHLTVWYDLLNKDLGAGLSREEVKHQMYGKNLEMFDRVFGSGRFTVEEANRLSWEKEVRYQELYKPHLALIPGLDNFLFRAKQSGIEMAIGSAAIPFNIDFVLDNMNIRQYFSAIVSAEDVIKSKPNPEVFLQAAARLGAAPETCIVFEDVPKGVEAALNAGMKSVVVTSMHTPEEFVQYPNVLFFVKDYTDPRLRQLISKVAA
jgi:beta-phosphoglucomutase